MVVLRERKGQWQLNFQNVETGYHFVKGTNLETAKNFSMSSAFHVQLYFLFIVFNSYIILTLLLRKLRFR